jgi:hypothetical protein
MVFSCVEDGAEAPFGLDVCGRDEWAVLVDAVLDLFDRWGVAVAVVRPLLALVSTLFPQEQDIDLFDLADGVDLSLFMLTTGDELTDVQVFEFDRF